MIGISGLGLLTVFFLKEIQMKDEKDQKYGLHEEKRQGDEEVGNEKKGDTPETQSTTA